MKILSTIFLLHLTYLSFGNTTDTTINNGANNPKFKLKNPHSSRYFFAPSAINIKKGEGYYQNTYLFLNSVNYGVTDNFSIGGGVVFPIFRFLQIYYFTPKVSAEISKNWRVSTGAFATIIRTTIGNKRNDKKNKTISAGLLFANTTVGDENKNLTVGLGLSYANGEESKKMPILNINGMLRVSDKIVLITENYFYMLNSNFFESNWGVTSGGFRFLSEKTVVDFGLVRPIIRNNSSDSETFFFGVPYINITLKIKNKKKG